MCSQIWPEFAEMRQTIWEISCAEGNYKNLECWSLYIANSYLLIAAFTQDQLSHLSKMSLSHPEQKLTKLSGQIQLNQ